MDGIYEVLIKTFAGCSREQMHLWVLLVGVAMAVLIGWLLYLVYKKGQKLQAEQFGQKLYATMEDSFRESSGSGYRKLQKWLKSIGAEYVVKGFGDPFQFLIINLLLGVGVVVLFGLFGSFWNGCVTVVMLFVTEVLVLIAIDRKSNKEMLNDISFLYDATAIQLTSHIYVAQAVANCLVYIRNKRLKQALTELCSNITLGGDVRTATKDFSEKFHNEYLDTFCNVIVQITAETGEAGRLIEDMSKQLAVLKETNFTSRKKSTENQLQVCIMGIFILFTVLIFVLCIASKTGSANMLF